MLLRSFIAANSRRSCLSSNAMTPYETNNTKLKKEEEEEEEQRQEEQWLHDRRAVCYSTAHDIYTNLAIEEAFLRGVYLHKHDKVLMFYINEPCLVIGRNQNVFNEVALRRACKEHIDIARRGSGGGAVYHDVGNLCLSLFTHRTQYDPAWLISFLTHALGSLLHVPFSLFTTTSRHDLFVNERKVTGSAMRVQRDIAMHHCTLLVNSDLSRIGRLLQTNGEYVHFRSSSTSSVRSSVTSINLISHKSQSHNKETSNTFINSNNNDNYEEFESANADSFKYKTWDVKEVRDYLAHYFLEHKEELSSSEEEKEEEWNKFNNEETNTVERAVESCQHNGIYTHNDTFNKITKLDLLYKSQKPTVQRATYENSNNIHESNNTNTKLRNYSYENFKFIYADGRPPQRGDSATFSDEISKLQSCKWLLDMPPFTSKVAITQGEMQKLMLEIVERQLQLQLQNKQELDKEEEEEEEEELYNGASEQKLTAEASTWSDKVAIHSWLSKTLFDQHDKERQLCIDTTVDHGVITSISVTLSELQQEQVEKTNCNNSHQNNSGESNGKNNSNEHTVNITNLSSTTEDIQSMHEKLKEKYESHNKVDGDEEVEWLTNFLSSLLVKARLEELLHLYENVGLSSKLCNVADWVLQGLEMEASRANVEIAIDVDNFHNTRKMLYLNAFVQTLFSC